MAPGLARRDCRSRLHGEGHGHPDAARHHRRRRARDAAPATLAVLPLVAAAGLFVLVVAPWAVARWRFDGWRFFEALFFQDFVARASSVLDGHEGAPYYYLYFLQKHHYDWLFAALVAGACLPGRWARLRALAMPSSADRGMAVLVASWFAATFLLPTVVVTKLGWYLNSFYPLFALGVAWLVVEAWRATAATNRGRARAVMAAAVIAFAVAEGKLAWHSYRLLDLDRSAQSLILIIERRLWTRRIYAAIGPTPIGSSCARRAGDAWWRRMSRPFLPRAGRTISGSASRTGTRGSWRSRPRVVRRCIAGGRA